MVQEAFGQFHFLYLMCGRCNFNSCIHFYFSIMIYLKKVFRLFAGRLNIVLPVCLFVICLKCD